MYNRNINKLSAIIQSPIAPRSTNVLWDDLVSNTLKVYRKGIWTVIGGAGGGGEGSSLYWGYDEIQGVIFPLDNRSVQINGDLTVNGDITARKLSVEELEIDGKPFEQYWELDSNTNTLSTTYQVLIKNSLIVEQDTSSGGEGESVLMGVQGISINGGAVVYPNSEGIVELTISGGGGTADLSNYYTKGEADARYLASSLLGNNTLIHSGNIGSYAPIYNASGNVTIGASDLAGTSAYAKLCIDGVLAMPKDDTRVLCGVLGFSEGNLYLGYSNISTYDTIVSGKNILINPSGGNVGIGTTSPAYKLDVNGDIATNQYLCIKAWTGYGSGSANAWYNGNTQMLLWDNVSGIGLGSNVVIHSGNIGSQWVDVANSLTNILIPSDLTTIGPKTINWCDWAQSTGQGIASYSYGIWTGAPDINYGFGFGADAFADELYFKLMRGGTVSPWRRVITTSNDGYTYGLGGYIDIQYSDEINRYGGNLHLQHRGGSGAAGSGTGGTTTGHILMCAYGGNVLIGTTVDSGYKLDVNGGIKATQPIFGYMYGTNNNAAAFIFDKPGLNYTGIGSDGVSDTIRFSACNVDGTWVDGYAQNWKFYGDVKADKYRLNENDNSFIGTQVGYLSLNSMGNEICIGASGYNDIHINYRPSADGTAPKTYYWRAGTATSWADFYMGNTCIQGNLVVSGDVASA